MLNLILGIIGLVFHVLVVYYGYRMYRILNPVRYWTGAWLLFSLGNSLILVRRCLGLYSLCSLLDFTWPVFFELLVQVIVSALLLLFVKQLNKLYTKYFTNGPDVPSWIEEGKKKK